MRKFKLILWIAVGLVFVLMILTVLFSKRTSATTNVSAADTEHFAWNDIVGWIDFYLTNSVTVWSKRIEGYASSSVGMISLDCATSPEGNICGISDYGICNGPGPHSNGSCPSGDASGILTGYAWNDTIGWVSFNCNQTSHGGSDQCLTSNYRVQVNTSNGHFTGWAWNDEVGWISFNCTDPGVCGTSDYKVVTSWTTTSTVAYLESATFDTQKTDGTKLNSIIWYGDLPDQTSVRFQIATSNSPTGPWNFVGPNGSTALYFTDECPLVGGASPTAESGKAICVGNLGDARYYRYKVKLLSDPNQLFTPVIRSIILNWSP